MLCLEAGRPTAAPEESGALEPHAWSAAWPPFRPASSLPASGPKTQTGRHRPPSFPAAQGAAGLLAPRLGWVSLISALCLPTP